MTRAGIPGVYLDTNFFIKVVEGTAESATPARKLVNVLRDRRQAAVTSELTLAEVLAPSKQPNAMPFATKKRAYLDLILWSILFSSFLSPETFSSRPSNCEA